MLVEIKILSGVRQGETIRFDSDTIRIGHAPDNHLAFDPQKDGGAAGRSGVLRRDENGWSLRNTGDGFLMVNHDVVRDTRALKSGDIVRLSDLGPEFRFVISGKGRAALAGAGAGGEGTTPDDSGPETATAEDNVSPAARVVVLVAVAILIAGAAIAFVPRLFPPAGDSEQETAPITVFRKIAPQSVREGERWVLPTVAGEVPAGCTFRLEGQPPAGAMVDPQTGDFTWTPDEKQGPGEYRISLVAEAPAGGAGAASHRLEFLVTVAEVNRPPTIDEIPPIRFDAETADTVNLSLTAGDPDLPPGKLFFRLGAEAPAGASIDGHTGRFSWRPSPADFGKSHRVQVMVADDALPPLTATRTFTVDVSQPDPWAQVKRNSPATIYLLVTKDPQGKASFPLGTATAIRDDTLLTSGVVAQEMQRRRDMKWSVEARAATGDDIVAIEQIRVHNAFASLAEEPDKQIFFDFGLLTVPKGPRPVCPLAASEDLARIEDGLPLGSLGVTHEGEPLSRFDSTEPHLIVGKVYGISRFPTDDGTSDGVPRLVNFRAALPRNLYGSPLLNEDGKIVAVYAEKAQLPPELKQGDFELHYAPLALLVSAWMQGFGLDQWQTPVVTILPETVPGP